MRQGFDSQNLVDERGFPAGGFVRGTGIRIDWQNGPLGRGPDRKPPNGAFVEDVIAAALQRLEFYQEANGQAFSCKENALAIAHLHAALRELDSRTQRREADQTEGTHKGC